MRITIRHKLTTMWSLKRKHRVVICDLKGNKIKTMWLNKDGSNRPKIDIEIERLSKC